MTFKSSVLKRSRGCRTASLWRAGWPPTACRKLGLR